MFTDVRDALTETRSGQKHSDCYKNGLSELYANIPESFSYTSFLLAYLRFIYVLVPGRLCTQRSMVPYRMPSFLMNYIQHYACTLFSPKYHSHYHKHSIMLRRTLARQSLFPKGRTHILFITCPSVMFRKDMVGIGTSVWTMLY